ncbi:MAG: hypothetical protein J5947_07785 [Clostridium sp.]|nr:hypothetical protein [Clostridium sp.]
MKKYLFSLLLVPAVVLAMTGTAFAENGTVSNGRYTFEDRYGDTVTVPVEAFAEEVIYFEHGNPWTSDPDNQDPNLTLGLPDSSNASESTGDLCLGDRGTIVVRLGLPFYDGEGNDLYIFEVGPNIEETKVSVSNDLSTWYDIGTAEGRTAGLDLAGKVPEGMAFSFVCLTDGDAKSDGSYPGADIDAVCGLNTRAATSSSGWTTGSTGYTGGNYGGNFIGNSDNGETYTFEDRYGNTVTVPTGAFAVELIGFKNGDPWTSDPDNQDPYLTLGLPDSSNASESTGDLCLGDRGNVVVRLGLPFYDGQGDDIYIFEVGPNIEETKVSVSSDLWNWYDIGIAEGRTAGLDLAGKVPAGMTFYYISLTDGDGKSDGSYPGADIDAVCALNTR